MAQEDFKLLTKSALDLAQMVRRHEVSAEELVTLSLDKIAQDNPELNAVIATRPEKALREVRELKDTGQPFLGVPLLIKGLGQSLAGEPDTYGSQLFKDAIAPTTNNFVQALQNAGFIIVGQTNVPEFAFKNITDSKLFGISKNSWKVDYAPGGSSGGAGSALADGMVPLATGNDGGGSIRIPASWSGLIGLKPTRGRVPVGPDDWRSWQGASINFALTRHVDDTAALLDQLQTVQPAAVFQVAKNATGFQNLLNQPLPKITIGYTTQSPVGTEVSAEAVTAVEHAVEFLEAQGIPTQEIELPTDGVGLMHTYYTMNEGETAAMFSHISEALDRELTLDDMEPLTWALYQTGRHITATEYVDALNSWDHAGYQMAQLHEQYPVILTPATAWEAPKADDPLVSADHLNMMKNITELAPAEQKQLIWDQWLPALTRSPFTQQANLTGNPAISLPTHVTNNGLPLGIQFETSKGREDLLLQLAKLFEEHDQFHMLNQ